MKQLLLFSTAILLTISSCKKDPDKVLHRTCATEGELSSPPSINGTTFSITQFETRLQAALDNRCVGYQYAISVNNKLIKNKGWGFARAEADGGVAMTACMRMNIASISKMITATALLQVLETEGVSVDDNIGQYFPPDWTIGAGFNNVTFRDLLLHNSGIQSTNTSWDTLRYERLKNMIAVGTGTNLNYLNANYALMRVLIPCLRTTDLSLINENYCALEYQKYVNKYVLNPCGIADAQFSTRAGDEAVWMYRFASGAVQGTAYDTDTDNWYFSSGGGGWYLSAVELSQFLDGIRTNDAVLSAANRTILTTTFTNSGWSRSPGNDVNSNTTVGVAYGHTGSVGYGGGQGFTTFAVQYPGNINAVLMINSLDMATGNTHPVAVNTLLTVLSQSWE